MIRHMLEVLLRALMGFFIFAGAWIVLTLMWWALFPYETSDVEVPMAVLNEDNQVVIGEDLRLLILFDKRTDVNPFVTRTVICENGRVFGIEVPNKSDSRPRGDGQRASDRYRIIDPEPEVDCFFRFKLSYQVNPIRNVVKVYDSDFFDIVQGE